MADEETTPILLVFVGSRIDSNGTGLDDYWLLVTPDEFESGIAPENKYRSYGKLAKKRIGGTPGTVYEVPEKVGSENSSIYPDQAKYKGMWPDQEKRTEWQVSHRTAVTTIDLRKRAKAEGGEDNFAVLMPFREQYRKLVSQDQRAALLAQMIAFVTAR